MTGKGIELTFTANAKQLLRSTSDVEEAFDAVADSLDDIATDSGKSTNILSKNFDKASEKVERSAEDIERSFKDVAKTVGETSAKAGRDLANNTQKGATAAKRDLEEVGNEARQNLAETASSFDGSMQSIVDGLQGTLGGLTTALGPIGAAAGAAAALGLGVLLNEIEKGTERTAEWKEEVNELAAEYIETGRLGTRSLESIIDKLKELALESEDGKVNLEELDKAAEESGNEFDRLAKAYAGNSSDLRKLIADAEEHKKALESEADALATGVDGYAEKVQALDNAAKATETYIGYLTDSATKAKEAEEAAILYAKAGGPELEAKAALLETVNAAYDDTAGSLSDFINKETGLFDTTKYIAAMEARSKALTDYQNNLASANLSPEAKAFLNEQGADAAASFLAGYSKATPAQKNKLNEIWTEAGREDSGTYRESVAKGFAGVPLKAPAVESLDLNVGDALRKAQKELDRAPLKATVINVDRFGKPLK